MTALTEHLARHAYVGGYLTCTCGWRYPEERTHGCGEESRIVSAHAAHVEAELLAAGIVAVQLPAPTEDRQWEVQDVGTAYAGSHGSVGLFDPFIKASLHVAPAEARRYAEAILAAASVADRPTPTPGDSTP